MRPATGRNPPDLPGGLFVRADDFEIRVDSATGGPDALRGIYPVIASIDVDGWSRVGDDELAGRYESIANEVSSR